MVRGARLFQLLLQRERVGWIEEQGYFNCSCSKKISDPDLQVTRFFFLCVIPFIAVEHWAFRALMAALAPAYLKLLPSRKTLSRKWLPKIFAATEEKVAARLSIKRLKTVIIDGFKDRRKRHVMNIAWGVIGFVAYLKTAWFGCRRHTGEVYGEELVSALGDFAEFTIAAVADNTGSMSSMQNGLFGYLSRKFPTWFLIGCVVHMYDLLQEDIVKQKFMADVVEKAKFIVTFVLRYSLVFVTFLHLQRRRRENDPKASMLSLKLFPDTRFAYAALMIVSVVLNWSILIQIVDTDEYKLCKRHAKTKARADFRRFEDLVGSVSLKRCLEAARRILGPLAVW
jgi:hypothetical protein